MSSLPGLPSPSALLLLSPTMDWGLTHVGPNSSLVRNARSDYVMPVFSSGYSCRALLGSLPADAAQTNAWISPASLKLKTVGLFAGLPRTCIVAGSAEQTLDPMITLRERLEADMGRENVVYIESMDSSHDFLITPWDDPERENVLQEIGKWEKGV